MSDLISRQAVIDSLAIDEELLKRVLDDMDVVGNEREKYEWGLGLIESYIADMKDLPSAQPEQRWIPVEERLPEECEHVLVTDADGDVEIAYWTREDIVEWWCGDYSVIPVAWMPLPEPWRGEEHEID